MITEKQIRREIENVTKVIVYFSDTSPEYIKIWKQGAECWIKPAFCEFKKIPCYIYSELKDQFTDEQKFITDSETIRTKLKYNMFFKKYYNVF